MVIPERKFPQLVLYLVVPCRKVPHVDISLAVPNRKFFTSFYIWHVPGREFSQRLSNSVYLQERSLNFPANNCLS
jgi:hypothetical protein